jgi:nitrate reductase beta subunit
VEGSLDEATLQLVEAAGTTPEEIEAIYQLTAKPSLQERFVVPPYHREMATEVWNDPLAHKGETGVGFIELPVRGD